MENTKDLIIGGGISYVDDTSSEKKDLFELLKDCPKNKTIVDNLVIAWNKINSLLYQKPVCSVSGGSDSDVMLDICTKVDSDKKIEYVWFDTGLEYQATKDHLLYLEKTYGITITKYRAIKPIPIVCNEYGQPFLSKYVSEMISRLQRHNFKWEDKSFDELYREYPKCKVALQWWCNCNISDRFDISRNKYLKEFMILNPPTFRISNKCCKYAKKDVLKKFITKNNCDLEINGVRKAEGGIRDVMYKSCFDSNKDYDRYRPLFWYTGEDKMDYELHYGIKHSDCYAKYGLKRTGCAGCPFGRDFEKELEIIKQYEPKLYVAVNNIFGKSYEYTRKYYDFRKQKEHKILTE